MQCGEKKNEFEAVIVDAGAVADSGSKKIGYLKGMLGRVCFKRPQNTISTRNEMTWDKLCSIEKKRRALLRTAYSASPAILLQVQGTVVPIILFDWLLWISLGFYTCVRILIRYADVPENLLPEVRMSQIALVDGCLTFFLVFLAMQSNRRFHTRYLASMSCEGRIFDSATLATSMLPKASARRLVRFMNAAHVAGYIGLTDIYTSDNFFNEINSKNKVLTEQELERLGLINMDTGGSVYRELIAWCIRDICDAESAGLLDGRNGLELKQQVLRLRGALGTLFDYADQPLSFFYVHFVTLLSYCYLPLFSYAFATSQATDASLSTEWVGFLIVLLQCTFVIGLRICAHNLNNPYGSDVHALSVMHYINFTWLMSRRIVESAFPPPVSASAEDKLCREAKDIGAAWQCNEGFDSIDV